jgi:hypothetical protein
MAFKIACFWRLGSKCCAPFTKTLVVDKRYAYKSCGKITIQKGVEI